MTKSEQKGDVKHHPSRQSSGVRCLRSQKCGVDVTARTLVRAYIASPRARSLVWQQTMRKDLSSLPLGMVICRTARVHRDTTTLCSCDVMPVASALPVLSTSRCKTLVSCDNRCLPKATIVPRQSPAAFQSFEASVSLKHSRTGNRTRLQISVESEHH